MSHPVLVFNPAFMGRLPAPPVDGNMVALASGTLASNLSIGAGGSYTVISWTEKTADANWSWTAGDTVLTVPSGLGVTHLAITVQSSLALSLAMLSLVVLVNSDQVSNAFCNSDSGEAIPTNLVVPVSAGDTVEFHAKSYSNATELLSGFSGTSFVIEAYAL